MKFTHSKKQKLLVTDTTGGETVLEGEAFHRDLTTSGCTQRNVVSSQMFPQQNIHLDMAFWRTMNQKEYFGTCGGELRPVTYLMNTSSLTDRSGRENTNQTRIIFQFQNCCSAFVRLLLLGSAWSGNLIVTWFIHSSIHHRYSIKLYFVQITSHAS